MGRRRPAGAAILILFTIAVAACSGGGSGSVPPNWPPIVTLEPAATATLPRLPTATRVLDATAIPTKRAIPAPAIPTARTADGPPTPTITANQTTINAGMALFTGGGFCASCHTIDGFASGVLGPDLTEIATVAGERRRGYTAEQYLWESIVDSCAYTVPQTDCRLMEATMSGVVLSDADVNALVAFLLQQR